ncbi:hypothetical protein WA158_004414 [Blastocystis sp. Blastoise]
MSVKTDYHISTRWFIAASCGTLAEFINLPLDMLKIRMQLNGEGQKVVQTAVRRFPIVKIAKNVIKEEGVKSLFAGGESALIRQLLCGGIGIGFYKPIKDLLYGKNTKNTFTQRVSVSIVTGLYGQLFALPLDTIKIRMQADGRLKKQGLPPRYTSFSNACISILRTEGIKAFYKSTGPTLCRCMCMSVSGVACYDQSRVIIKQYIGKDDTHSFYYKCIYSTFASLISGVLCTLVASPFDVVKTRLVNQHYGKELYKGSWDCFVKTLRTEGVSALFKGFSITVLRFVPWQFIFYNTTEIMSQYLLHDTLTR